MEYKSRNNQKNLNGIAILVPMFNEESGARLCVHEVQKTLKKIKLKTLLIVVDDGSTDRTSIILDKLKYIYKRNLVVIHHKSNKGYGAAIQTGGLAAYNLNYKYVIVFDSDLTNSTNHIELFATLYNENWDLIKGSRFIKNGSMVNVPLKRKLISFFGNIIASSMFSMGLHDCTNGLRMIKTNLIIKIPHKENGFASILEELYYLKKRNIRITEIPNHLVTRTETSSKFVYTPKLLSRYFYYAFLALLSNIHKSSIINDK